MKTLGSFFVGTALIVSMIACSKVALERNAGDAAVEAAPGEVTSSTQLQNPDVLANVIPNLEDCEDADSDAYSCLIILDSFERDDIHQSIEDGGFGWSELIYDVVGSNGERVEAAIYNDGELGPTLDAVTGPETDQKRSLLFTGRQGSSVHSIFLVSSPIDLTNYNSVFLSFRQLPIDLETWEWDSRDGNESVRLEICEASLSACGVVPELDEDRLNSTNWGVRYLSQPGAGDGLNGHNHTLAQWRTAAVDIDLSGMTPEQKANFVFRITVTLDEGFMDENQKILGDLEDGVALDNVVVMASKFETSGTPEVANPGVTPNGNGNVYPD